MVQGVIRLLEVQGYGVKDHLPYGCQLLEQIIIKGGGPCPTSHPETMHGVMVSDFRGQPPVNDTGGGLQ